MKIKFNNSQEAIKFGKTASIEQIEFLKQRMLVTRVRAKKLLKEYKLDAASIAAFEAQLDNEAITAKEILNHYPELRI